jgi:nitrogen-specific signal transduction histidine kinase
MAEPDPPPLEQFEHLCHQVSNPLMIIAGHAYLLERAVRRLPDLPDHECEQLITELAQITQTVRSMATQLDTHREMLIESEGQP